MHTTNSGSLCLFISVKNGMKVKLLIESGDPERIGSNFQFTEGPVWSSYPPKPITEDLSQLR